MKRIIFNIFIIITSIVILSSCVFIIFTLRQEEAEKEIYDTLQEISGLSNSFSASIQDDSEHGYNIPCEVHTKQEVASKINWDELRSVNEDIIGWIEISDIELSLPILYSNDSYYIDHDVLNNNNKSGAIFTDSDSNDRISILYGHNMRNGSMFGGLKKLYRNAVLNSEVSIYYPDNSFFVGHVFAMTVVDKDSILFNTPEEGLTEEYLKLIKNTSFYYEDIDLVSEKMTILSTCYGYAGTSKRLLVFVY